MTRRTDIAHCPDCGSDAIAIADGRAYPDDHWALLIRCGECGQWRDLLVSGDAMRELEAAVMAGWHAIERDLQRASESVDYPADRSETR